MIGIGVQDLLTDPCDIRTSRPLESSSLQKYTDDILKLLSTNLDSRKLINNGNPGHNKHGKRAKENSLEIFLWHVAINSKGNWGLR